MSRSIDSRTMVGTEREVVLRALAKCRHHRRLGYRTLIVAAIEVHKAWPDAPYWDHQADAVDMLRFVYRHQLEWPIGIYEPPISRVTGGDMGLTTHTRLSGGTLAGAQDEHGNPVWRRWNGEIPAPLSGECCV